MVSRTLPGQMALEGFWAYKEDGWKEGMDANLLKLSFLVQASVINFVDELPIGSSEGDRYILTTTNGLNVYDDGDWFEMIPWSGMTVWDTGQARMMTYVSGVAGWVNFFTSENIKTLYEASPDTNALTDLLKAKLEGIEDNATRDLTAAEVRTLYESNTDTNPFTDADKTKLDSLDPDGDELSNADVKTMYEANLNTNAFTDAMQTKLTNIEDNATADQTAAEIRDILDILFGNTDWRTSGSGGTASFPDMTGNVGKVLAVNGTEDGTEWIDPATGGSMTGAEIVTAITTELGNEDWMDGSVAGVTATYWKFTDLVADHDTILEVAELVLVDSQGATLAPMTATTSTLSSGNASYLTDGSDITLVAFGTAPANGNSTVTYQFSEAVLPSQVKIISPAYGGVDGDRAPTGWTLWSSNDGIVWTEVMSVSGESLFGSPETRTYDLPVSNTGEMSGEEIATALTEYLGSDSWTGDASGADIVSAIDTELAGTAWRDDGSTEVSLTAGYWKFTDIKADHDTYLQVAEMSLQDETGTTLVPTTTMITGMTGGDASYLTDDSSITLCSFGTASNGTATITFEYAAVVTADHVKIVSPAYGGVDGNRAPTSWVLWNSQDGINWTKVKTVVVDPLYGSPETRTHSLQPESDTALVTARYWRVANMYALNAVDNCSAALLEFRSEVGGVKLSGTFAASTVFSASYDASKLDDDDPTTLWSSSATNSWVSIDLGAGNTANVAEIAMQARNDSYASQTPISWILQYSDDGVTWTSIAIKTGGTAWSASEVREYDLSDKTIVPIDPLAGYLPEISITEQTVSFSITNDHLAGNRYVEANSASALIVTVPAGLTGTEPMVVERANSGSVTFAADVGVTLNSPGALLAVGNQYGSAVLVPKGADVFVLQGDLA